MQQGLCRVHLSEVRLVTWHGPCLSLGLGTNVFLSFENKGGGRGEDRGRNAEFLGLISTKNWDVHPDSGCFSGFCGWL